MSDDLVLPEGWSPTTLGQLGRYLNGRAFKTSEWSNTGRPIIRIQDLTGSNRNPNYFDGEVEGRYVVRSGDFLISWSATLGAYIWDGPEAVLNQHIFKVESAIDTRFHYHLVRERITELERKAHGSGMVHVTKGIFDSTPVAVPDDPDVQRLLADVIDRADALRDSSAAHLAAARTAIQRFRRAVLATACSGRLTADWREKRLNADIDGDLPTGWRNFELQDLAADGAPIRYGIVKPGPEVAGGIPYVRQQDVIGGAVLVHQLAHTSPEIAFRYRGSALREGDVLLGIIRNLRVAIVPPGLDGANITQGMVRIRPRPGVEGGYLALYLGSPAAQRWMHDRYVGLAMPRINVQDARVIPVPLPPQDEQTEIVKRARKLLSVADEVATRIDRATSNLERSNHAVLVKAFRGELTAAEVCRRS